MTTSPAKIIISRMMLASFAPWIAVFAFAQGPESAEAPAADARAERVLIVGATRNTGLETARVLLERGIPVVAFARPGSDHSALEALDVPIIEGDAMVAEDLVAAIDQGPWRAVVTTLSCYKCENPPDYEGNRNLFDAMQKSPDRRVIFISSVGVGDSRAATNWIVEWILRDPLKLKEQAEAYLFDTDLAYTIIRPGGLTEASPTGDGILTEDPTRMGIISRPDLAELIADVVENDQSIGKTYTAIDKNKHWLWDMYGD